MFLGFFYSVIMGNFLSKFYIIFKKLRILKYGILIYFFFYFNKYLKNIDNIFFDI